MFGITYLSDADRERIEHLQTKLLQPEGRSNPGPIQDEIREIESRRKELNNCTLPEVQELKVQVWKKYNKLVGIGRHMQAYQLSFMLEQIDLHMNRLRMIEPVEPARSKRIIDEVSPVKSQTHAVGSRWTLRIDDDD